MANPIYGCGVCQQMTKNELKIKFVRVVFVNNKSV